MACSRKESGEQTNCRKSIPAQQVDAYGGTIINIVAAMIFLGLFGLGIWCVIKSVGEAGQQYTDTMIETRYTATTVKCQTNLRAIGQNIQMYGITNGRFPPSLEELVEWSGSTQLFRCPVPDGERYVYIPGQKVACPLRMFFCTNQRLFITDVAAYCDWAGRLNCSLLKKFNKL